MAPAISINLWWTTETEQDDLEHAVDVLEDTLGPQLDCPVDLQVQSEIDLQSDAFDSYAAYLDAFEDTVDGEAGTINLCLYEYLFEGIDEALEMGLDKLDAALDDSIPDDVYLVCGMDPDTGEPIKEQAPWIGYADSDLRPGEPTYTIVNASTRHFSTAFEDFFANVLMHEVLHSSLLMTERQRVMTTRTGPTRTVKTPRCSRRTPRRSLQTSHRGPGVISRTVYSWSTTIPRRSPGARFRKCRGT